MVGFGWEYGVGEDAFSGGDSEFDIVERGEPAKYVSALDIAGFDTE